jgi:hypothetical protein
MRVPASDPTSLRQCAIATWQIDRLIAEQHLARAVPWLGDVVLPFDRQRGERCHEHGTPLCAGDDSVNVIVRRFVDAVTFELDPHLTTASYADERVDAQFHAGVGAPQLVESLNRLLHRRGYVDLWIGPIEP